MARPLRIELSGGIYHVTSRGDGREDIYLSVTDRESWLEVFGQVCQRFNWVCHAWCQMTNHYHLLIETPEANLAQGMRQLNGVYTQRFNRDHEKAMGSGLASCMLSLLTKLLMGTPFPAVHQNPGQIYLIPHMRHAVK